MTEKAIQHIYKDEDYTYASGLLKAREELFLLKDEFDLLKSLNNTYEIIQHLEGKRYTFKEKNIDSLSFENILLRRYLEEIEEITESLPEKYLLSFFAIIRSLIYKPEPKLLKLDSSKNFEDKLRELIQISKKGTIYTKEISSCIIDKLNISEQFRALLNKEKSNIYYESGNISKIALETLFNSLFSEIPYEIQNSRWQTFFYKYSPLKVIDFNIIFNFENYWLDLLESLAEEKRGKPYGLDYIISYFLRFLLETLNLQRLFLLAQYKVKTFLGETFK